MQPDDGSRLAVGPIGLDHLPSKGEPAPPVGLDENASLVAVAVRFTTRTSFTASGSLILGTARAYRRRG